MDRSTLSKLANCLSQTLSKDNSIRKTAEDELMALSAHSERYFSLLIHLILDSHPETTIEIKTSAVLCVKRFIKDVCNTDLAKEDRLQYATHIFSVMISNNIDASLRAAFGYTLVPLFFGQNEILYSFFPLLDSAMRSESSSLLGSIKVIKSIFNGSVYNQSLFPFFIKILPGFIEMSNTTLRNLSEFLERDDKIGAVENALMIFEWVSALNGIFEHFDVCSKDSLNQIKDIAEIPMVLKQIAGIFLDNPDLPQPSILNTNPSTLSIKLNQVKTKVFQCFNMVLQYLIDHKRKITEKSLRNLIITPIGLDIPESPYINAIADMLPSIIHSLQMITMHTNSDALLKYEYISELFTELMMIIQKVSTDNRFSEFFRAKYKEIIVLLCLPLMKCSENEQEAFEDDPTEFVSLSNDICTLQESETLKSAAAALVNSLCHKIDGSLKFLVEFCSELVDFTVTQRGLSSFSSLNVAHTNQIISLSEESRIDISLLSLCTVSYLASRRLDLLLILEKLLVDHLSILYTQGTNLIKNRLCMLIHYYKDAVFAKDDPGFYKMLLLILESCNPIKNPSASVSIQASETLSSLLQNKETNVRINHLVPEILTTFIELILYQNNKTFFEAFQELAVENTELVLPQLPSLIVTLVAKAVKENRSKGTKKSSVISIKCCNIIRSLLECKSISSKQLTDVEIQLIPLFELIGTPNEIDFEDEIIMLEVIIMKRCKIVTDIGWSMFNSLSLIQEKHDYTFLQIFSVLNCYIAYGQDILARDAHLLSDLCKMSGKCLFSSYKNTNNEVANAEGALIFHQLLLTYKGLLDSELPSILAYALLKLSNPITNDFLKAKTFGIIFASFAYNANQTLSILQTSNFSFGMNYCQYTFSALSETTQTFKHPYDKKLAVYGLCSLFSQNSITDSLGSVLDIIISLFSVPSEVPFVGQGVQPARKAKEGLKSFNFEEMELNLILDSFICPLEHFDEVEHFKQLIKSFQKTDLTELVKSLSQVQSQRLIELLQSKSIKIGESALSTDVRRIIKPKSRY